MKSTPAVCSDKSAQPLHSISFYGTMAVWTN
jgi:hypothetical protein